MGMASLSDKLKPETCLEEMFRSTRQDSPGLQGTARTESKVGTGWETPGTGNGASRDKRSEESINQGVGDGGVG
jgi:hypothetical protein